MRIIAVIAGILLVLLGVGYGLVFSQPGNNIVKPFIENKVAEAIQKEVSITTFSLRPGSLALQLEVDTSAVLKVEGEMKLLDQWFDMRYSIDAQKLETPALVIREPIQISGEAKGFVEDFQTQGTGAALGANVAYAVAVKGKQLTQADAKVTGLPIGDVLELVGQPRFGEGLVDIDANTQADGELKAIVTIAQGKVNEATVQEHFSVAIPPNTTYQGLVQGTLKGDVLNADGAVKSSLANVDIKSLVANIKTMKWESLLYAYAPDLGKLESLAGMPLAGDLGLDIALEGDEDGVIAKATTTSLGGTLVANAQGNNVALDAQNVRLEAVLERLAMPQYSTAKIQANGDFRGLGTKEQQGTLEAKLEEGIPNVDQIKELAGIALPKTTRYEAQADAKLLGDALNFTADVASTLANIDVTSGAMDLASGSMSANYRLHVNELGELAFLTGHKLHGEMTLDGDVKSSAEGLRATGQTAVLGGESNFVFEKEQLDVRLQDFLFKRISEIAGVPYVFESVGNATLGYNVAQGTGAFDVIFPEGKLIQSELTQLVQVATGYNMTQEIYKNTDLTGQISPAKVTYDFEMNGERSYLHAKNGLLDRENMRLNAPFDLMVDKRKLSGTIKGDIARPSVKINASDVLKEKLNEQIEKNIPEESKGMVKELMKLF